MESPYMKKLENYKNSLEVLKSADFEKAYSDEIYRTGIIGQFNLTFELAWKATQAVMQEHGVEGSETGSPKELLKLGYKCGFLDDGDVWLTMLKKRNQSTHIYDEDEIDELILLIRDTFIKRMETLVQVLEKKSEPEVGEGQ